MKKRTGRNNPNWRNGKASYMTAHRWIIKKLGKANHCEECGLDKIPEGMKRYFEWSNKDHKYKLDLKDWKQLCKQCHVNFDIGHNDFRNLSGRKNQI